MIYIDSRENVMHLSYAAHSISVGVGCLAKMVQYTHKEKARFLTNRKEEGRSGLGHVQ